MKPQDNPSELFSALAESMPQDRYQAQLLEQYKLYVEMADRVSARRLTANSYLLSVNAALVAIAGTLLSKDDSANLAWVGIAGVILSLVWFSIISAYRDLNTAKFSIIHAIEQRLPLRLYSAEWTAMGRGLQPALYRPISHIERVVPWVFVALYLYLTAHAAIDRVMSAVGG